jgi:hypothetical protein
MLRGKERGEPDVGRIVQKIDRAAPFLVTTGVIRYQSDPLASYEVSGISQQHRNARRDLTVQVSCEAQYD